MGTLRNPKALIVVNGVPLPVMSLEVNLTTTQSSDTFHATLALNALPGGFGWDFWASIKNATVSALINGVEQVNGDIDKINLHADKTTVDVSGRDNSKKPMETKGTKGYRNKTSSGIVGEIAGKHGLTAAIDATTDKAGKTHDLNDWVKLTDQHSDWSVLQHLADREGKVCYVSKNVLHFEPLDSDSGGDYPVIFVPPSAAGVAFSTNVVSLSFDRNLEAGKPTDVNVHSHHTKTNQSFHSKVSVPGTGTKRVYEDRVAGLKTKNQGDKIAKKRAREHTRHEISVHYEGPGDETVTPRMRLVVSGTGTELDQPYYMDSVSMHVDQSFTMRITAKNTAKGRGAGQ